MRAVLGSDGALQLWRDCFDAGHTFGLAEGEMRGTAQGFVAGALFAGLVILALAALVGAVRTWRARRGGGRGTGAVAALALALVLATVPARAQSPAPAPSLDGRRELQLDAPEYAGTRAQAPIADPHRIQNEGGSDGAGLCVISSLIQNGQEQGVPMTAGGKQSPLWRYAKARPGGYGPAKLAEALDAIDPAEPWASYVGTDLSVLRSVLQLGYPVGITYSWGDGYPGRIHHMVSGEHDGPGGLAMVADNNFSGPPIVARPKHTVMAAAELERRVFDGRTYWLFVWTRRPVPGGTLAPWLATAGVFLLGGLASVVQVLSHVSAPIRP